MPSFGWICCLYFFFWKRSHIPGRLHLLRTALDFSPCSPCLPRARIVGLSHLYTWFMMCWGSNPEAAPTNWATAPRHPCLLFSEPPSGYKFYCWKAQLTGPDFSGLEEPPVLGQRITRPGTARNLAALGTVKPDFHFNVAQPSSFRLIFDKRKDTQTSQLQTVASWGVCGESLQMEGRAISQRLKSQKPEEARDPRD